MNKYDAIIIGAGHNGLASAVMLADKGWDVLVLEKKDTPGGAAKSEEVTAPGFLHDLFSMNIKLFLNSKFYQMYKEEMKADGFEPVFSDKPFASVYPDGTGIAAYQDRREMYKSIAKHSTHDTYAWKELNDLYDKSVPYIMSLMQQELPSFAAGRTMLGALKDLKLKGSLEVSSELMKSPRQLVDSWFENDKVKSFIIPWGYQMDFAPDVTGGAAFPLIEAIGGYRNGIPLSKGGVRKIIDGMVKLLERRGGTLRTGQTVAEIITENGKATGVKLEDGETIYAEKAVIGNITPTQLVDHLLSKKDLPKPFIKKANNYRYGPKTMMIHLALDEPLQWKAGKEFSEFTYVHIGPYVEDIARTHTQALNNVLPDNPLLIVGQPDAVDPTRSPEGKATVWIMVRSLPAEPQADALGEIMPGPWSAMKDIYADRVLDKLETYTTNLREKLISLKIYSPEDLEKENPNLYGGDHMAGSHQLFQHFLFRPVSGYSRYNMPLKNLYLIGAATWPGGGLNAGSGYLLGKKLG